MTDREPTAPFRRSGTWVAQSTTVFDPAPKRLARGSTAPWPPIEAELDADERDATSPIPRLIALLEPPPSIPVRLDDSPPRAPRVETITAPIESVRPARGAILTVVVLAIAAALLALMLLG
jgi:hypothetical protein